MEGVLAGLNVVNLLAGVALGIVFGGKVRAGLSAVLGRLAEWVK